MTKWLTSWGRWYTANSNAKSRTTLQIKYSVNTGYFLTLRHYCMRLTQGSSTNFRYSYLQHESIQLTRELVIQSWTLDHTRLQISYFSVCYEASQQQHCRHTYLLIHRLSVTLALHCTNTWTVANICTTMDGFASLTSRKQNIKQLHFGK